MEHYRILAGSDTARAVAHVRIGLRWKWVEVLRHYWLLLPKKRTLRSKSSTF
jgi:hypothetical protein